MASSSPTIESSEIGPNPHGSSARTLSLVDVRCALCGADDPKPEAYGYDYEYNTAANLFRWVRCRACGHICLNPRPSAADLSVIYPPTYYTLAGTGGFVAAMRRRWEGAKVRRWAELIGDGPRRVLDVGCGEGRILETLREFGPADWSLVGIDFDPAAVERCKARGFAAYERRVEDFHDADGSFDAVLMLQLIEHVEDPALLSERVFALLRPGGVFIIETPNLGGLDYRMFGRRWWSHYHIPRHWNLFSASSLSAMLESKGFEVVSREALLSPAAYVISLHNYVLDRGFPRWLVGATSYKNPLLPGVFTVLDAARVRLGLPTSNQRVVARRPLNGG